MSSLTDKLKDLGVQIGTSQVSSKLKTRGSGQDLLDVLPGCWEKSLAGDCFVVRKEISRSISHGSRDLSISHAVDIFDSLVSFEGIAEVPLSEYLFIDTETTGLSGGAGTYVFLIGAAKFQQDNIHFAQFFLQDPGFESAQLAALEAFGASSRVLISYNGKSFDLPRIKTRYRYHGWPDPFSDAIHLDLLHVARRLWRNHLPSCTLGDLEYHLLDLRRSELDIPGWKVSENFFTYLREGDPVPLKSIFYHNEADVLSLIALLGYITERLSDPMEENREGLDDTISIGKYLSHLGQPQAAIRVLTEALSDNNLPKEFWLEGAEELADLYKKGGLYENALSLWQQSANRGSVASKIELAKYFEHREVDLGEALHWTLSALEDCHQHPPVGQIKLEAELQHRLDRLKKKAKL